MKRALAAVIGFLAMALPVSAEQSFDEAARFALYPADIFASVDASVLVADLQMWTFLDRALPGSTELGQMGAAAVDAPAGELAAEPSYTTAEVQRIVVHAGREKTFARNGKEAKDYAAAEAMPLQPGSTLYTGGEVGFMYGHVTGKWGGDLFSSYIVGEVGDDKFHVNVGASYEEFHGRVPRWRP